MLQTADNIVGEIIPRNALRPFRGKFKHQGAHISGEHQRAKISAQPLSHFARNALAKSMQITPLAQVVDYLANIIEIVLAKKKAFRAHCAFNHGLDDTRRRKPHDNVRSSRPRIDRQAQRLALRRLARHILLAPEKRSCNVIELLIALQTLEQRLTIDVVSLDNCDLKPLTELPLNLRFTM